MLWFFLYDINDEYWIEKSILINNKYEIQLYMVLSFILIYDLFFNYDNIFIFCILNR